MKRRGEGADRGSKDHRAQVGVEASVEAEREEPGQLGFGRTGVIQGRGGIGGLRVTVSAVVSHGVQASQGREGTTAFRGSEIEGDGH